MDQATASGFSLRRVQGASPAAAIERAQGMWRTLGHAGAAAFVRVGYPDGQITVLRTFGSVPEDFEA